MEGSIIIIDSDDELDANKAKSKNDSQITTTNRKRSNETIINNENGPCKQRRIQPLKIGEIEKKEKPETSSSQETLSDLDAKESIISLNSSTTISEINTKTEDNEDNPTTSNDTKKEKLKNEVTKELEAFINACRKAENNSDMKKIIKCKLLKYYDLVHPEYAQSKYLRKMLEETALAILRDPKTVYSKLQDVINELKSRKNCGPIVVAEQSEQSETSQENGVEIEGTGDEKKDSRIRKLNKALTKLKKAIEDLEEAEVNLDEEEDSAYMKKVRYEKRAVEIYNKICELTGESTHAHRIVKQPVKFKSTKYKEFNRRLSKKVNKENGFPSYYDVFRLMDFCNREYKYGLFKEEIENVSQHAFIEVGKLLKDRRRNDLYESAEHYAGKNKDPAKDDPELKAKLEKNKEYYKKKTDEILQLFVTKQLNGEEGETEDVEMGEPSCANDTKNVNDSNGNEESSKDLRSMPTKNIMSIIDIQAADCDMNGEKNTESPVIDLAISL